MTAHIRLSSKQQLGSHLSTPLPFATLLSVLHTSLLSHTLSHTSLHPLSTVMVHFGIHERLAVTLSVCFYTIAALLMVTCNKVGGTTLGSSLSAPCRSTLVLIIPIHSTVGVGLPRNAMAPTVVSNIHWSALAPGNRQRGHVQDASPAVECNQSFGWADRPQCRWPWSQHILPPLRRYLLLSGNSWDIFFFFSRHMGIPFSTAIRAINISPPSHVDRLPEDLSCPSPSLSVLQSLDNDAHDPPLSLASSPFAVSMWALPQSSTLQATLSVWPRVWPQRCMLWLSESHCPPSAIHPSTLSTTTMSSHSSS